MTDERRGADVGREWRIRPAALEGGARRVEEAAGIMTGAAAALRTGTEGLEPWGTGAVGTVMAAVRDLMGEACAHLGDNLAETGAAMRAMAVEAVAADAAALPRRDL
ncbi:hypothetical protein [Nonomuraea angiospora]|uniref:hypothetical protein n=1 Tax=Nonomuraea angiospora TaxID=46172 RepID=UPI0029B8E35F|nr:hypothetical protein [Nonomuraea angiospora]MDX3107280.1 hypothetical protein [Nonomuraea angiospora]